VGLIRLLLLVALFTRPLYAQRINSIGMTTDFMGGADNDARASGLPLQGGPMKPVFGLFPSVSWNSAGARGSYNISYAYGWQRTTGELKHDSQTHAVNLALTDRFSPRWSTTISGSFSSSNDVQTFYALRGVLPTPEGVTYVFSPLAIDQTVYSNTVSAAFDHALNQKSGLVFSGSFSLRNYPDGGRGLSNQHDGSGSVQYTRKTSEHTTWNLAYTASLYQFDLFNDATSNAVQAGMSTQFARGSTFGWSFGASRAESRQSSGSYGSLVASVSLQQKIKDNIFDASFSQDNSPTGLGSISQSRRVRLGLNRSVGRRGNVFASFSAFDGKAILDNPYSTRGGIATANLGFLLTRKLSLQIGGQYQRYTQPVIYRFTEKRIFASLRYTHPNLWRSH